LIGGITHDSALKYPIVPLREISMDWKLSKHASGTFSRRVRRSNSRT
jgi:hypothetical protein